MYRAIDIANYLLSLADADAGDLISHLKLQKLCYYAQGFHLALFDKPLFEEKIEAWQHGPVVPILYHEFKEFGNSAIAAPTDMDFEIYDTDTAELLEEIWEVFGQFSAGKLRNMTHDEPPWSNTEQGKTISHEAMKEYFKTLIN